MTGRPSRVAGAPRAPLAAWLILASWLACGPLRAQAGSNDSSSVQIRETIIRYPLTARSIEALRTQLKHDLPPSDAAKGTHGRTHSEIAIAYEFDRSTDGCRLRDLEVRLDIVVTLPQWDPGTVIPLRQWAQWERTLGALERHDAIHRANARAAAEEARVRMLAIGPQTDCKSARDAANRMLRKTRLKYELRDLRFDARTRNGRTKSAAL